MLINDHQRVASSTAATVLRSFMRLSLVVGLLTSAWLRLPSAYAVDEESMQSPLYTEYNTFIRSQNFLELLAAGSQPVSAKVSFYKIDGTFQKAVRVDLEPQQQVDLDVNTLVGVNDTYGVVKVEFGGASDLRRLQGRMAVYRVNDTDSDFSFAYVLPLRTPLTGRSAATSNTFDAQGRGFVVPNWLSVTNLDDAAQEFTHTRYAQDGSVVDSTTITLNPFERRDIAAGDFSTEGVYLNEIVPTDSTVEYLSSIVRYGSNTLPGGIFRSYTFAMPVFAKNPSGDAQFMPISNQSGDCWTQTNWVEVVNTSSSTVNAELLFRDAAGLTFSTTTTTLAPRSQFHFNASMMLENKNSDVGVVRVSADTAESLIAQSVVYFHDCRRNLLQTAYNIQSNTPNDVPLIGSFNRFLAQENELRVYGVSGVNRTVELSLNSNTETISTSTFPLSNFAVELFQLNDEQFATTEDTYGTIALDANYDDSMMAYTLRLRKSGADTTKVNFAVPIEAR
ncbi:MAG: hypothetical protein KDD69_07465 [Bdellovibrionales bacterium]|nr:hypothetical protein [Bdellovibrionales bacterium]